jgi:nitroreductase
MNTISPESLLAQLNWRYATKKFDPARIIADGIWSALEQTLVLTPSSHDMQPWKFLVIDSHDLRDRLQPLTWGTQLMDCSHFVVFARRNNFGAADVARVIDSISLVRAIPRADLRSLEEGIVGDLVSGPRHDIINDWASLQVYIALGSFISAAAVLGVDTCPIEGLDFAKYDEVLGLPSEGYSTVVACAAGYRSTDDDYAAAKKVRLPFSQVVEHR